MNSDFFRSLENVVTIILMWLEYEPKRRYMWCTNTVANDVHMLWQMVYLYCGEWCSYAVANDVPTLWQMIYLYCGKWFILEHWSIGMQMIYFLILVSIGAYTINLVVTRIYLVINGWSLPSRNARSSDNVQRKRSVSDGKKVSGLSYMLSFVLIYALYNSYICICFEWYVCICFI